MATMTTMTTIWAAVAGPRVAALAEVLQVVVPLAETEAALTLLLQVEVLQVVVPLAETEAALTLLLQTLLLQVPPHRRLQWQA